MFVHGNNLEQKENHQTKYRDAESRRYLVEIRARYNQWKAANEALVGPVSVAGANDAAIIARRVELLNIKSFWISNTMPRNLIRARTFTPLFWRSLCTICFATLFVEFQKRR